MLIRETKILINSLINCKKRKRREEFIFQESGAKDLYVGWPFVQGQLNDGTDICGPLCFFPVSLEVEKRLGLKTKKKSLYQF